MGRVSLRDYFERRFEDHAQLHTAQQEADQRALEAAQAVIERRLQGLNELRAEVLQDRLQFLPVATYDAKHEATLARIDELTKDLAAVKEEQSNQRGRQAAYAAMLAVFLVVVSIATSILF